MNRNGSMDALIDGAVLPSGTWFGGDDELPAGTWHGGDDELPAGTWHCGSI